MPAATPVTTPVLLTEAIPAALVLHVPPVVALLSVIEAPAHTAEGPVMVPAEAVRFTVTANVATSVPQPLVTL